jgi:hypothetical protein
MTIPAHKNLETILSQPSLLTQAPSAATLQELANALMERSRRLMQEYPHLNLVGEGWSCADALTR